MGQPKKKHLSWPAHPTVFGSNSVPDILVGMKNANHGSKEHRAFRRLVRQLLARWTRQHNCTCHAQTRMILGLLQSIEGSIEIMARELGRQSKRTER